MTYHYDLQKARKMELDLRGTSDITELKERISDLRLFTPSKDKIYVVPSEEYLSLNKISKFFIDHTPTKFNGFTRIVYQINPEGKIKEAYLLCNTESFSFFEPNLRNTEFQDRHLGIQAMLK